MWIKGNEKIDGSHLIWKDEAGNEFETWNPTEDFLIEQGWTKEVEVEEEESHVKSLKDLKDEIIQESNDFYRATILKADFHGELVWIPLETRVAYLQVLKDVQEVGIDWAEYRNHKIKVKDAISALKAMNVYEFTCREVRDQHTKNIIKSNSPTKIELYDYTENYPEQLKLS